MSETEENLLNSLLDQPRLMNSVTPTGRHSRGIKLQS